ncbi:hypothetical protein [Acetobacter fallax]|uniref:Uncharacterized protein n=1 Tax=Acetobacter fallax TaxID=1737473 RepID=A0ABX0KGM8_9PROT|nr:hypothetical protein [Acetobacter fallax]NHO34301.1 hypothetical protein [Acetobacter fallax]NHO37861.1 hypothetical protein [Acetobacter fallax]
MNIDKKKGLQAFADAKKLAESWLTDDILKAGTGETREEFVERQVTTAPPLENDNIFRLYCINSQNRGGARNLLDDSNWTALGKSVLGDYNYTYVSEKYPCTDTGFVSLCADVLNAHKNGLEIIKGDTRNHIQALEDPLRNKTKAWVKILTTIQEGATLFSAIEKKHPGIALKEALFGPVPEDTPVNRVTIENIKLAVNAVRVKYVGDALAFNFLKDLGNRHFFKPDIHTCEVVGYAFTKAGHPIPDNQPFETIEKILLFSHVTGIPLAEIDRIMWLSGSGIFQAPKVSGGPWIEHATLPKGTAGKEIRQKRKHEMAKLFRQAVTSFD